MTFESHSGSAAVQATLWGQRAGDWAEQEEWTSPLFRAVFDEVELSSGTRLLDVGCGAGVACRLARERGAHIVGLDATPELLAIAREQVPQGEFHLGDMEHLPFATDRFDVVTCFNALPFAANPMNALREVKRVVRSDGQAVLSVLTHPDRSDWFRTQLETVRALLPPRPPDAPDLTALSNFETLSAFARDAGLHPVSQAYVSCPGIYADEEEAVRLWLSTGPIVKAMSVVGEATLRSAIVKRLPDFQQADGTYHLDLEFMYLVTSA